MRDFATQAAPDAAIDHRRDRIRAERVGVGLDREGWTAGKPDAGMIASAGISDRRRSALAPRGHLLARALHNWGLMRRCLFSMHSLCATMTFGPFVGVVSASRRTSRIPATSYVRVIVRTHFTPTPRTASAIEQLRRADRVGGGGGKDVLAAGGGGIAVVDHDEHAVALIEHGIADAARQAVMPEPAVPHDADGARAVSSAC